MSIKTRYFTVAEARQIISRARDPVQHTAFTIGFAVGPRVGELVTMKPIHWRFDEGYVDVLDSKKTDPQLVRHVPFLEDEGAVVERFIVANDIGPEDIMFPKHTRTYNRYVQAAAKKLGIVGAGEQIVRWHSFRGTYVRFHQDHPTNPKSTQWLKQTTGDSAEVLEEHYRELTTQDLVSIQRRGSRT